ncbi:hypothetical protein SCAB_46921 [Streptomyces scabiei 87.22]|uniref:Uncharacterized protein n=1 Tax=Streptomyces scabiei (strain 87.22) TaxID=680198 RepID=C9ZC55_STRSW|nr:MULTISPECIES: hypothetical protein [Streptomyces]MDX2574889.1 hypothetical protein [Streptomyces scabiei]MDX2650809.1 hypothetical protein [Streptomyces scabiei]MDX2719849.1 hypothetical protein [Streptomyces scabiei]MDX2868843.1 hypothetical protein [Streptomyces scabiei]MDX2886017.1 hypothetical protein [Streptomyces scabiei]
MRPFIQSALERSAELTRDNRLVDAVALAEAAIKRATPNEHREIEQWLTDHAHDFTGEDDL